MARGVGVAWDSESPRGRGKVVFLNVGLSLLRLAETIGCMPVCRATVKYNVKQEYGTININTASRNMARWLMKRFHVKGRTSDAERCISSSLKYVCVLTPLDVRALKPTTPWSIINSVVALQKSVKVYLGEVSMIPNLYHILRARFLICLSVQWRFVVARRKIPGEKTGINQTVYSRVMTGAFFFVHGPVDI